MFNLDKFYQLSEPETRRWPRLPRWLYLTIVALLSVVMTFSSIIVGSILDNVLFADMPWSDYPAVSSMVTLILNFAPMFLFVYVILKLLEKRGFASLGMQRGNAVRNYVRGSMIGLVLTGTIILILWLLGAVTLENPLNAVSVGGAFIVLIGWIVQGAAEEVVFRGFFLQIFGRMTNTPFAITISSLIFMLVHGGGEAIGLITKLNLFLIALFLAVYELYEGGLWGAFGIHAVYNWAQNNLFGIEFSTGTSKSSIVIDLVQVGREFLAGSAFGLEGSIICTVVMLVGFFLLFAFGKRLQTEA